MGVPKPLHGRLEREDALVERVLVLGAIGRLLAEPRLGVEVIIGDANAGVGPDLELAPADGLPPGNLALLRAEQARPCQKDSRGQRRGCGRHRRVSHAAHTHACASLDHCFAPQSARPRLQSQGSTAPSPKTLASPC